MHPAVDKPAGFVTKVPGGYFVASRSTAGCWWFVSGTACSCPAGQRAGDTPTRCWHFTQTVAYERLLNPPRPVAPPHISAMVD